MVKGMRKAKTSGDEVAAPDLRRPSLGVRITRAKSMAMKKASSSLFEGLSSDKKGGDGCYLQLRSRRLEWRVAPLVKRAKKNKSSKRGIAFNKKNGKKNEDEEKQENKFENEGEEGAAFGDNDELDQVENKERFDRESTPISCIMRSEDIPSTPPPLKRPSRMLKTPTGPLNLQGAITPSAELLEDFFRSVECHMEDRVKKFIEEYNFDPVNEKPLKGRYEWVEVTP